MNCNQTKQFILLNGKPIVLYSLEAFQACEFVKEIIVVSKKDEMHLYNELATNHSITKLKCVVEGGDTRAKSASNGFEAVSSNCSYIAIHDAARPLVDINIITDVFNAAYPKGSAIAACKCKDTVKIADKKGFIESTPEREYLWLAQTPQIFY